MRPLYHTKATTHEIDRIEGAITPLTTRAAPLAAGERASPVGFCSRIRPEAHRLTHNSRPDCTNRAKGHQNCALIEGARRASPGSLDRSAGTTPPDSLTHGQSAARRSCRPTRPETACSNEKGVLHEPTSERACRPYAKGEPDFSDSPLQARMRLRAMGVRPRR